MKEAINLKQYSDELAEVAKKHPDFKVVTINYGNGDESFHPIDDRTVTNYFYHDERFILGHWSDSKKEFISEDEIVDLELGLELNAVLIN